MPFGGTKASGYGRFGGTEALREFTECQWIAIHDDATGEAQSETDVL
jgi:acyl-CoA reductase-like NAD-dependent aldehyde dehydrogenase